MVDVAVQNPREQVADAEALLDITNTLVTSVKAHGNEGITPSDFLSCLLRQFGDQVGGPSSSMDESQNSIRWEKVGLAVSNVFKSARGCCTMLVLIGIPFICCLVFSFPLKANLHFFPF